jgi:hypothetical protein
MPKRLGSTKVAVSALIAMGAIGGSVAYAYPSATSMVVSATAQPTGNGGASVVVTVYNANPHCQIDIDVQGADAVVVPAERTGTPEATSITRTVTSATGAGQSKVKVTAANCTTKEKTQTVFDIIEPRLETNSTVYYQGDQITVRGYSFTPDANITLRLTPGGADKSLEQTATDVTNKKGEARGRFSIPGNAPTGNWVLSAYTGSVHNETIIEIEHPGG